MKGLLRKDLYMMWKYCRAYILLILVFVPISLTETENAFYTSYPVILGSILPLTLLSYEESCKWNVYCQTLPVPRWLVVAEKYLLSALCGLVILAVTGVVQLIVFLRQPTFADGQYLSLMATLLSLSLLAPSLTMPLIFKLGCEKGRLMYYIAVGGACVVGFLLNDPRLSSISLPQAVLPVTALAAFALSCLLSIRFYEKREL